jgi:hypothetical protein
LLNVEASLKWHIEGPASPPSWAPLEPEELPPELPLLDEVPDDEPDVLPEEDPEVEDAPDELDDVLDPEDDDVLLDEASAPPLDAEPPFDPLDEASAPPLDVDPPDDVEAPLEALPDEVPDDAELDVIAPSPPESPARYGFGVPRIELHPVPAVPARPTASATIDHRAEVLITTLLSAPPQPRCSPRSARPARARSARAQTSSRPPPRGPRRR